MRRIHIAILALGVAGCSETANYAYQPVEESPVAQVDQSSSQQSSSQPVARYDVPSGSPRGQVTLTSLGMSDMPVGAEDTQIRFLQVRMTVTNTNDTAPWTVDIRQQLLALPNEGQSQPSFVNTDQRDLPNITVNPGQTRNIDLYYALPQDLQAARETPAADLSWHVQTPSQAVAQRTPIQAQQLQAQVASAATEQGTPYATEQGTPYATGQSTLYATGQSTPYATDYGDYSGGDYGDIGYPDDYSYDGGPGVWGLGYGWGPVWWFNPFFSSVTFAHPVFFGRHAFLARHPFAFAPRGIHSVGVGHRFVSRGFHNGFARSGVNLRGGSAFRGRSPGSPAFHGGAFAFHRGSPAFHGGSFHGGGFHGGGFHGGGFHGGGFHGGGGGFHGGGGGFHGGGGGFHGGGGGGGHR